MPRKAEYTSKQMAEIAARGIKSPGSLTQKEIQAVCASALTQTEDRKAAKVAAVTVVTMPPGWPRWAVLEADGRLSAVPETRAQARQFLGDGGRAIPVQVIRRPRP